jgi:4-hydroxybenzoate polyprenyltransferase
MTRFLPYFQLVRLPNVFTAMADICLGALVTGALAAPGLWPAFVLLLLASSCLYASGMVWNDFFDIKQDERERPFRPLPSRKVSMAAAFGLGAGLMAVGIVLAALADLRGGGFRPCSVVVAVLIAGAILLYDGWLKRTWAGPLGMGLCRFLNVLLGLSLLAEWVRPGLLPALVVGVYIAGVTLCARTEARTSERGQIVAAALIMLVALVLAVMLPAALPVPVDPDTGRPQSSQVQFGQLLYPYLLVGFAVFVGLPLSRAFRLPSPKNVQSAVKRQIFGLVVLDSILATAFAGPLALLLLLLLIPTRFLGRWVYST